ncbi:MAG: hypothetical protein LBF40_09665 [Deltaproteobacteria bacterium]|jgi:hypothetical protein|nr:hypothetical protein [Deltaproteobacteria bacterium]
MRSWLPFLVRELEAGREPVLAQTLNGESRAAILDPGGAVLAGDWRGSGMFRGAKGLIGEMVPAKPLIAVSAEKKRFLLEKQAGKWALGFWGEALEGQERAWAAWLLTIARSSGKNLKVTRHVLSALGPWTTPRLPRTEDDWSLLPLNAGLGRFFVFGDDDLALESAALGGRIGLKATLVTLKPKAPEADSFRSVGDFDVVALDRWQDLTPERLGSLGLRTGVYVLVTTKDSQAFLSELERIQVGWLGLAGAAAPHGNEPGLFPAALTPAQKAVGLITQMLE